MAGGPRKFSEKIALLNQKEAEGNAAFDSIMVEVKSIRPNNSGSQIDMIDSLSETNSLKSNVNHSAIDETISFNEHISVTYDNQSRQKASSINQTQSHKHKKHDSHRNNFHKNNETIQNITQSPILTNNSFLQLPTQNESFRRAHSDSSLNQSVSNVANNNFVPNQNLTNLTSQQINQFQNQHHLNLNFQQQQSYQQNNYTQSNNFQAHSQQNFNPNLTEFNESQSKNFILPLTNSINSSSNTSLPSTNRNNQNVSSLPSSSNINQASLSLSLQPQTVESNIQLSSSNSTSKQASYLLPKFKNEPVSPTFILPRNYNLQNSPQDISTNEFNFQASANFTNSAQLLQQQYQATFQQSQNSNNQNNNFLNPNITNTAGGSLPDLTAFQFQNNQIQQNIQIHEYNQRIQNNYDFQLLQPNFQQHNHIGPVKPTHGSVSPTRAMSRYSPTQTNSNLNSIGNRRPSPSRHLSGLNTQPLLSKNVVTAQSTPNSPLHPSIQTLPVLEFTVNSQQVNSYINGNALMSNTTNNGIYRNGPNSTGINGESLPPSPQSQQSCFNSPQGSPGPLSISPQDANPFSSPNSYDIMQKKFDSINLDSSNNTATFNKYLNSNVIISQSSSLVNLNNGTVIGNLVNNKSIINNQNHNDKNLNNNNNNNDNLNKTNININGNTDSDAGANNHSIINSRNGSLSSNGSVNNLVNNCNLFEDLQNLNSNYQNQQILINKNNISNKNHKNSIPNIILTYSGDSTEEKNDIIIKDLSNDLNYDEELLNKNDQFDLDLQILSEPVTIDETNSINFSINEQTLYHDT